MSPIDYSVIVIYFLVVIGLGFWYQKRASRNLASYFLGGNRMHWLTLSMSGSVSNFDITGTMWIVSILYVLGMRSMWQHWMWGCMMAAFCMAYMGKWVRRSRVMTAAEWMVTRFGDGPAGRLARITYALMAVLTLASFIGYAFQGIGKFVPVFLELDPVAIGMEPAILQRLCASVVIGITTLYVLIGGLFSVVITDVIQTVILTVVAVVIAAIAYVELSPDTIAGSLPSDWASLMPVWKIDGLAEENASYELFGALVIVWVLKGFLMNAGGPAQMYDFQRFLAARDSRDAAKIGASWSLFLVVRWAMAMGIVLLALTGIRSVTDPEEVMPMVLKEYLPVGVRGIVVAGFLAAFMSTFSSTVNSGASFIVRDLWQPIFARSADQRKLVMAGYMATVGIVLAGVAIGFEADSIAEIWNWMMMALGAGVILPNALRWYWWRMNGWGYSAGTLAGIAFSIVALFDPDQPMYVVFPVIAAGSLLFSIALTLLTEPVDGKILETFYRTVRPFGRWGPVRRSIDREEQLGDPPAESPLRSLGNTALGMVAITGLWLFPMFLVGHWHLRALLCLIAGLAAVGVLAVTWYPHLPPREDPTFRECDPGHGGADPGGD